MLQYKCELVGIKVKLIEESYTSKCSFLDNESIKKHEKYQGRRIKRGLFKTSKGILINADVNASLNIKGYSDFLLLFLNSILRLWRAHAITITLSFI